MLKQIVKRDGSVETFTPSKLNKWAMWATDSLGDRVDWSGVVLEALSNCKETENSQNLQKELINACLYKKDWPHNVMAGRLYAAWLHKDVFGDEMPTVETLQKSLLNTGLTIDMGYTDDEYVEIEKIIDHTRDFNYAHSQIKQIYSKYSISNLISGKRYETPQYTYMRMAMRLSNNIEDSEKKLVMVKDYYDEFSFNRLNAPTPNYVNLGTTLNGFASCSLHTVGDSNDSIDASDIIASKMTAASAGIGTYHNLRSIGDPVRGGRFPHGGKRPYFATTAKSVIKGVQAGRAGAATLYFDIFEKEAKDLIMLQNPRTPEAKRNRDVHFAVMTNSFFAKKARDGGKIFSFNCFTAPDLHAALFSGDIKNFEILYDKYEKNDSFVKEYVDARELCLSMLTQFEEVSTLYHFNIEEANRHTSFQEPIHSSNLCVAPETMLLTDKGLHRIQSLAGKIVNVWNGKQWSTVPVVKTGVNQKLLTVMFSDGKHISCTPYHKFYIVKLSGEIEVRAAQLKVGDVTVGFKLPDGKISGLIRVTSITDNGRLDDTYCLNEPIEHKVVFNGILTGNCLEITEPDAPYAGVKDLYRTEDYGQVTIKTSDNNIHKLTYNLRINVVGRGVTFAGSLRHGEVFSTLEDDPLKNVTVSELISKEIPGEVALCSLAATVLTNIHTDEQYAKTAKLALRMIDRCIHLSDYALPHIGFTAKSRLNAGVGHIGLATVLARKGLKYGTLEGRNEIHHISERHLYFMTLAALELGEELGNAPWIHKTKWPNGWLPIDSYNKNVDELVTVGLEYDWETLRSRIIKNGGIRFSSLVALMPTESSSKASGAPNGPYPIRALTLKKSDENNVLDWVATDSDLLADAYTIGYDVEGTDLIKDYAVMQKLTDHSISADTYKDRSVDVMLSDRQIMTEYLTMMRYGVKSKYYSNTLTNSADGSGEKKEVNVEENCGDSCKL